MLKGRRQGGECVWIEEVSVNDEEAKEGGKRLTCGVPVAFFVFFSRNGMM